VRKAWAVSLAAALTFLCLFAARPLSGQEGRKTPPAGCCYWIYAAGVETGMFLGPVRSADASDAEIVLLLFRVGEWIERAHLSCSEPLGVWDEYRGMRLELDRLADKLAEKPGPEARGEIEDYLVRAEREYAAGLRGRKITQQADGRVTSVAIESCRQRYFLLGYHLGAAHHSFQTAAMAEPDSEEGMTARFYGLDHVSQALKALNSLKEMKSTTETCVPLWSDRLSVMNTLQAAAEELSRDRQKYGSLRLLGMIFEARREIAAVFGDPAAGPAPPGVDGCPESAGRTAAEAKKARDGGWLGDVERLRARLKRLIKE